MTEGLGLTAVGSEVFENFGWNEQRATATGQGIMRRYSRRRRDLPYRQNSLLRVFESSSGTAASPYALLD